MAREHVDERLQLGEPEERKKRIELANYCRKTDKENLIQDEIDWLLLDTQLRPHLYTHATEEDWLREPAEKAARE